MPPGVAGGVPLGGPAGRGGIPPIPPGRGAMPPGAAPGGAAGRGGRPPTPAGRGGAPRPAGRGTALGAAGLAVGAGAGFLAVVGLAAAFLAGAFLVAAFLAARFGAAFLALVFFFAARFGAAFLALVFFFAARFGAAFLAFDFLPAAPLRIDLRAAPFFFVALFFFAAAPLRFDTLPVLRALGRFAAMVFGLRLRLAAVLRDPVLRFAARVVPPDFFSSAPLISFAPAAPDRPPFLGLALLVLLVALLIAFVVVLLATRRDSPGGPSMLFRMFAMPCAMQSAPPDRASPRRARHRFPIRVRAPLKPPSPRNGSAASVFRQEIVVSGLFLPAFRS